MGKSKAKRQKPKWVRSGAACFYISHISDAVVATTSLLPVCDRERSVSLAVKALIRSYTGMGHCLYQIMKGCLFLRDTSIGQTELDLDSPPTRSRPVLAFRPLDPFPGPAFFRSSVEVKS